MVSIPGFALGLLLVAIGALALFFQDRAVAIVRRMELRNRTPEELRWTAKIVGIVVIAAGLIVIATAAIPAVTP